MARMVPHRSETELAAHRPTSEADAYRALRDSTPNEWLIIFDKRSIAQPEAASPTSIQTDFIVFVPESGFLIIEMKGGIIKINDSTGKWTRLNDKGQPNEMEDPTAQALGSLKMLISAVRKSRGWTKNDPQYLLTGHALLFPDLTDSDVAQLSQPPDLSRPQEILGGKSALENIEAWIRGVFSFWARNNAEWQPLGAEGMRVAEQLFCSQIIIKRPLAHLLKIEHEQQDITLTNQQTDVLRLLVWHPRALIAGGAGTGKTLIALHKAKELAKQGLRTLFVCYNKGLSDYLDRNCEGLENLHAYTWDMLVSRRIGDVKKSRNIDVSQLIAKEYPALHDDDTLQAYAVARSTELVPFRYEAIIVDEGQDFPKAVFLAFKKLLADQKQSSWYIFFDYNQAVYQKKFEFPIKVFPVPLTKNCRSTRYIHDAAYAFYKGEQHTDLPDTPGDRLMLLAASDMQSQAVQIHALVEQLIHDEKIAPDQICVLVAANSCHPYRDALRAQGQPRGAFWSVEKYWQARGVTVDTVKRFKGLETSIVILWGIEDVAIDIAREMLYVALSRSRSRVWLAGDGTRLLRTLHSAAENLAMLERALPP